MRPPTKVTRQGALSFCSGMPISSYNSPIDNFFGITVHSN
jgi:hypothetical protein